ncbi:MAG: endolytic transglycosylase MltG [Pseudomonadota bacterium]
MWRNIASNAFSLMIVGLFAVGGLIAWAQASYRAEGPSDQAACFQVASGSNFRIVSTQLAEQDLIPEDRAWIFRTGVDYSGAAGSLKAGSFLIPAGASMAEITGLLTGSGQSTCGTEIVKRVNLTSVSFDVRELNPSTNRYESLGSFASDATEIPAAYVAARDDVSTRYRLVVAEGITNIQIERALEESALFNGEVVEMPSEGFLAPGSYEFSPGTAVQDIVDEMNARQIAVLESAWAERDGDLPLSDPNEALVLASIIEKETALAEERGVVAGVFVNRLDRGMRLQTDPTIIYGITRGAYVLERGITNADIRGETERRVHGEITYNTYQVDGLPPGPIANPGEASIRAALSPEETDFIFFVADGTGGHAFAATLDEHNANVRKWREIEAQRQ